MQFTSSGQKQRFEIQIQIDFDLVDWGLTGSLRGNLLLADIVSV
jgi:hypothetical protein